MRKRCLAAGLACATLALLWQALTVRYNYGGNWTGLFCTGDKQRLPPAVAGENVYLFADSFGYDGQFYHYIAHDPLGRTELPAYIDAPRMRYGRILVPALAWMLGAGQFRLIDGAYFAVVLLFVFLGGYWTASFAAASGRSALWGILFLATPAALVSIDRMTVDVALASLCAGLVATAASRRGLAEFMLLAAAPLARETGVALTAAYCLWALARRDRRRMWLGVMSLLPFAAWSLYAASRFGKMPLELISRMPFGGLWAAIAHPYPYPWNAALNAFVTGTDLLALAGALGAAVLAFRYGVGRTSSLLEFSILSFAAATAALAVTAPRDVWVQVYGYGRVLSPLMLLVALRGLERGTRAELAPLALSLPRIGLQFGSAALRVARGLMS